MRRPATLLLQSIALVAFSISGIASARGDPAGHISQLSPFVRQGLVVICDSLRDRMLLVAGSDGELGFGSVYERPLDGSGDWVQLPTGYGPGHRVYPSVVLDTVHDQLVLFGGQRWTVQGPTYNDVWVLPLGAGGVWTQLTPTGGPPVARSGAQAIFDPVSGKMFLAGGTSPAAGDAWALSLGPSPAWERLSVPVDLPSRILATGILDPVRRRMVIFGGFPSGSPLVNDTWTLPLDPPFEWSRIYTSGPIPTARVGHVAIYEPALDAMLVHSGTDPSGSAVPDEIWKLNLSGSPSWSLVPTTGLLPGIRTLGAALFDRKRTRMILVGGQTPDLNRALVSRIHALNSTTNSWITLEARNVLDTLLVGHKSVYDPIRDRMLVFGGRRLGAPMIAMPFTGTQAWTDVVPGASTKPSNRTGSGVVYDPVRDRVIVFSGGTVQNNLPYLRDLWSLNMTPSDQWVQLTTSSLRPTSRSGAAMCFDPIRDRLVVFGGRDSTGVRNDVWQLPLSGAQAMTWSLLTPSGAPPDAREYATLVYDPVNDQMVMGGGSLSDDVWQLSLGPAPQWSVVQAAGVPPSFGAHASFYDPVRTRLVVQSTPLDDVLRTWSLTLGASPHWVAAVPTGDQNRSLDLATMAYDASRDRALIYGGREERRAYFEIEFGSPLVPRLTSAGEKEWLKGTTALVPFMVANPFTFPQTVDWRTRDDRNWPGSVSTGSLTVPALDSATFIVSVPVPDSAAPGVNHIRAHGMLRTTQQAVDGSLSLRDMTTATTVSLAAATAEPGIVRIAWFASDPNAGPWVVERSEPGTGWCAVRTIAADGGGWIRFEDAAVAPGERYGYRLRLASEPQGAAGETWIDVPGEFDFALVGARPNPNAEDLVLSFRLPSTAPARIELLDLMGRTVRSIELARPERGAHFVPLDSRHELAAGLYFARLTQGPLRQIRKVTVVR